MSYRKGMMGNWEEKLEIAEVVQNWALWRDFGDWERLATTFHPEGMMTTTRSTGTAREFIAAAAERRGQGARGTHFMGGSSVRVNGAKGLAESRLILLSRAMLDGDEVDITCHGRFFDRFVRHDGRWCILRRNVIYEKDRIDPVQPGVVLRLDAAELARLPEGYRHLGYVQGRGGAKVAPDLPTPRSAALERLYREAEEWLTAP